MVIGHYSLALRTEDQHAWLWFNFLSQNQNLGYCTLLSQPFILRVAGHILRKVYNCTERKKIQTSKYFQTSCEKICLISWKFPTTFFSHLPTKMFHFIHQKFWRPSFFQTLQVQLHNQLFCIIHSQNFTLFTILFYVFTLFLFKIYNYNCTIPILKLQTTFYNCTNCHQLHIKICPGLAY